MKHFRLFNALLVLEALPLATALAQGPSTFTNFEGAQTNPIRMSTDGTRLFAVNTPAAQVSVFDLTQPSSPALIAQIPVGIEPVSVNPRTDDEAWVVNQESDSVSIISVSKGIVTDTIYCKDEPADVVFAGTNLAFVSVARSNMINVYDVVTHALVKSIPLTGLNPRAMAASSDGSRVFATFALAGNGSTIVSVSQAPPPPPPTNKQLPPPPQVSLIVDATDPKWSSVIQYTVPSNGVVEIDAARLKAIAYFPRVGTLNLGIAIQPVTGNLFVSNTDALNLTMFEPALDGHIVNHRVTIVDPATASITPVDLNPGINYSLLPNPAAVAIALAQPAGLAFSTSGQTLYIAAFGTDRIGVFNTQTNQITARVEIDPSATGSTVNPATKRGPRGLAINNNAQVLYVLNRISNSISMVNTANNTVTSEIPTGTFDPTPQAILSGRGFLYDHKLSGNGTGSCASCHLDADMDFLSWNLGDPGGNMATVTQGHKTFEMHPMKGPMFTQSLRGLANMLPYHWRGDRANFAAFNPAFNSLLGGAQLSPSDMTAFTNFINTIVYQPNPNLNLDGTMPATLTLPERNTTGDPNAGLTAYFTAPINSQNQTCSFCHPVDPGAGTNNKINAARATGDADQPLKVPQERSQYQKININFKRGAVSLGGFGFLHDGASDSLFKFISSFPLIGVNPTMAANIEAYVFCLDTGMAPAVGYSRTLTSSSVTGSQTDWNTLQSQAAAGHIDLIANGTLNGQINGLLYQPGANNYVTSTTGLGPFTQTQLITMIQAGDTLTIMGAPPGSGSWMAFSRGNGSGSNSRVTEKHARR